MGLSESQLADLMKRCISLAKQASSPVRPPYVGALVLDALGTVIGEGYKCMLENTGFVMHAERSAIYSVAMQNLRGATLVTTLEPCIGIRQTVFRPCADLIIERGIERVVIGLLDGSPSMGAGDGVAYLKQHGVEVIQYNGMQRVIVRELMPYSHRIAFSTSK